jgi:hypothetical protein
MSMERLMLHLVLWCPFSFLVDLKFVHWSSKSSFFLVPDLFFCEDLHRALIFLDRFVFPSASAPRSAGQFAQSVRQFFFPVPIGFSVCSSPGRISRQQPSLQSAPVCFSEPIFLPLSSASASVRVECTCPLPRLSLAPPILGPALAVSRASTSWSSV